MKKWKLIPLMALAALFALGATACGGSHSGSDPEDRYEDYDPDKKPGGDQFDFKGNYEAPELTIDGKGDEAQWKATGVLTTFGRDNHASVKVYRGEKAIFFLFEVQDSVLLTEGVTNDDAVTRSDSIELYLDTKADGGAHPQTDDFQINLAIHGKTRIMQGAGREWGSWNGLVDYEVALDGTLNNGTDPVDEGYSIEVMIPYTQIVIEKDDTIGVAFGHVDKFGNGNSLDTDWKWYGWDWGGKFREPQVPDNYALLDEDGILHDRSDKPVANATIAGNVVDGQNAPVEGADVTLHSNPEQKTVTDARGQFSFADIEPNREYRVTVEKDGHVTAEDVYTREELRAADGKTVTHGIILAKVGEVVATTLTGTVKNVAYGAVAGAKVAVKGSDPEISATTGADGTFTLAGVPANTGAVTLVVSKDSYAESETTVAAATLKPLDTTEVGDVNLSLPWADCGIFAPGTNKGVHLADFANIHFYLTRTLTGIVFRFEGTRKLDGRVEIYFDTKESGGKRESDATAWRFDLTPTDVVTNHYGTGMGDVMPSTGLIYVISANSDTEGYRSTFTIPYSFVDLSPTEVFGISLGQWSTVANDWDGWDYNATFVAPEETQNYMRVGARNELYRETVNGNKTLAALSGNVGVAGITVSVGATTAQSGANGDWSMNAPVGSEAITVTYSGIGYVTKTTQIAEHYFDTHFDWSENVTMEERHVTITGQVTDTEGAPLVGVDVQLSGGGNGTSTIAHTDASGNYTIQDVKTFGEITLTFTLDGYAEGTLRITLAELTAGDTYTAAVKELTSTSSIKKITLTGTVKGIEGSLQGVNVKLQGKDTVLGTTGDDGAFTVTGFDAVDGTVVFEKDGYVAESVLFEASAVSGNSHALGEVFLKRTMAVLGGAFGTKSDAFAHFIPSVTRAKDGFEFEFVGSKAFAGHIEMFVDTKGSSQRVSNEGEDDKRNFDDYRFDLNADGTVSVNNWGGPNTGTTTLKLQVTGASTETPKVEFYIPYAFLGVEPTEIVGVSFGQSNGGWDGWSCDSMPGFNGTGFVAPEMTMDYIRIGVDNRPFECSYNYDPAKLDLSQYPIHFAQKGDSFYAKVVERNETGVTFEFVTLGNFGTARQGEGTSGVAGETEMVILYFDTDDNAGTSDWNGINYAIKIFSNGTVYGKEGRPWWLATETDKTGETVTITRENGVTKFQYTVKYDRIGIAADAVFGVAMREASHGGNDHHLYDPWYDCFYNETNYVDAAAESQYIRVKADGTLTKANSNPEVE